MQLNGTEPRLEVCFLTRHLKNLVLRSWKYKTWCNLPSHRAQWVQRQHCHVSINICGFCRGGGKTLVHFLQSPNYILPFLAKQRESVCKRIWGSHSRLRWDNDDFHLCWCWLLLLPTSIPQLHPNTQCHINEHRCRQTHYLSALCNPKGILFFKKNSPFLGQF